MNTNMQGHNHGGKNHLLGMLGIGALVLVLLLATGTSFRTALSFAALLACPLMMGGMMFMMMRGGNSQPRTDDATEHHQGNDTSEHQAQGAPATWDDSPNITPQFPQANTQP